MKRLLKTLMPLVLIATVLVVYLAVSGDDAPMNAGQRRIEVRSVEVDTNDLQAMSRWARGACRGWTVEKMAAAAGVEPTMEAVLEHVSEGFPAPASRVVKKVCEYELTQTANGRKRD